MRNAIPSFDFIPRWARPREIALLFGLILNCSGIAVAHANNSCFSENTIAALNSDEKGDAKQKIYGVATQICERLLSGEITTKEAVKLLEQEKKRLLVGKS